jgi:hypothetical protein
MEPEAALELEAALEPDTEPAADAAAPPLDRGPSQPPGFVPPVLRDWAPAGGQTAAEPVEAPAAPPASETPSPIVGAWLPPSTTSRPGDAATPGPAVTTLAGASRPWAASPTAEPPRWPGSLEPLEPAATPGATSPAAGPSWAPAPRAAAETAAPGPEVGRPKPGDAPLFADLPFDAPDTLAAWLVAIGGGIATVGFFLPWAPQVLGSAGFGSYFDQWGFGTIAHLPVFVAVLATTLLSVVSNRVAGWLRHGVLGLAVGGFVLGISWPYLAGGFGGQIGSLLEGVGAILLIIGGVLGAAPTRGSREAP